MNNDFFTDKACGLFLGLAIGDALGAPVEGLKPGHIKTLFKILDDYVDASTFFKKGIKSFRLKGLYTDDTQQMLTVCDCLLNHNDITSDLLADKFKTLCLDDTCGGFGVFRGTGYYFRKTMTELLDGINWEQAAGATAGCMAAVRIPPVIIANYENINKLAGKIIETSIVTHKNPMGISAALWHAYIIRELIPLTPGDPIDFDKIFSESAEFCRNNETYLAKSYKHLLYSSHDEGIYAVSSMIPDFYKILRTKNVERIDEFILDYAREYASGPVHKINVPFCLTIIPQAIKMFYLNHHSFEQPVIESVNSGGDTDTLAALTGSYCGAYYGLENIPEKWVKGLVNFSQIKLRAEAMINTKIKQLLTPLKDMEHKLTLHEHNFLKKYESLKKPKKPKKQPAVKNEDTFHEDDDINPSIPKRTDKVKWRDYEKQKSQNKRKRRKDNLRDEPFE